MTTNIELSKDIKEVNETLNKLVTTVTLIDDRQQQDEENHAVLEIKVNKNTSRYVGFNGNAGVDERLRVIQTLLEERKEEKKQDKKFTIDRQLIAYGAVFSVLSAILISVTNYFIG